MQNISFLSICIGLITISIFIGTLYFITTMIQLKKTAKEIENFTRKINTESPLLDFVILANNLFSLLKNKINFFFSKNKEEE